MLVALCAKAAKVSGKALNLKAAGKFRQCRQRPEILLVNVRDGLAARADHVVVNVIVQLYAQGAVMHAELFEHAFLNEKMNILVHGRERYGGDTILDPRIDLFRARMAVRCLHHFIKHLPLMGRDKAMLRAEFMESTHLYAG